AVSDAWSPEQRVSYLRQIVGTSTVQGAPSDAIVKSFGAAIAEAKAQRDQRTTAVLYSQLATVQANAGNVSAAHQSLAMAKAARADVPWSVHYYGAMAHGLMKHWAPANQELSALKAQAENDEAVSKDMLAALEGYQL